MTIVTKYYHTLHLPFTLGWPLYMRFTHTVYAGESEYAMERLTNSFETIHHPGAPKEEIDFNQTIDLYDDCMTEVDDEGGIMPPLLDACGLTENTVVVIYSDHGMEFFEHNSWGQCIFVIGVANKHIPLAIRAPRRAVRDKVQHSIDIAPILLECDDAPSVATIDGESLACCLMMDDSRPEFDAFIETCIWIGDIIGLPDDYLYHPDLLDLMETPDRSSGTLTVRREYCVGILTAKEYMIRSGSWKHSNQPLKYGALLQLFDIEAGADCKPHVFSHHPDIAKTL